MSLPRTPSKTLLPSLTQQTNPAPDIAADTWDRQPANPDKISTSLPNKPPSQQDQGTVPGSIAPASPPTSPRRVGPAPRPMLRSRERSISNPVLIRPLPTTPDAGKRSPTSDPTSPPVSPRTPVSPRAPVSAFRRQPQKSKELPSTLPHLSPRVSSSSSDASSSPSSLALPGSPTAPPQPSAAQQAIDALTDLVDQHMKKNRDMCAPFSVNALPSPLQAYIKNIKTPDIHFKDLMVRLFKDDLTQSETWTIALGLAATIKTKFFMTSSSVTLCETIDQRDMDLLKTYAANFAGAFFNVSTQNKLERLPALLLSFLEGADHRLILNLLPADSDGKLPSEEFSQKRVKQFLTLLIDNFLSPVVLEDIFVVRGLVRGDIIAAAVINALYEAANSIAPVFITQSLAHAPSNVQRVIAQKRINDFRQRASASIGSNSNAEQLITPVSPRGRDAERRIRLNTFFKQLHMEMAALPQQLDLPSELQQLIKRHNNEFATIGEIDRHTAWKSWLDIARTWDAEHPVTKALMLLCERMEEDMREAKSLEEILPSLDKSGTITTSSLTHTRETMDTTPAIVQAPTITTITATAAPYTTTEINSSQSVGMSAIPYDFSSYSHSSGRHSITRLPKQVRSGAKHLSPSSTMPSATVHRRRNTADGSMPVARQEFLQLSADQRDQLLRVFPQLMRAAITQIAAAHPKNPATCIMEQGRNQLTLNLDALSLSVGGTHLSRASHAKLLKALFINDLSHCQAGQILANMRVNAVQSIGGNPSAAAIVSKTDSESQGNNLTAAALAYGESAVTTIFAKGLAQAGLPSPLLLLWREVDQVICDLFGQTEMRAQELDQLRSAMGFDLIFTRLIYPLALGHGDTLSSAMAMQFANGVRAAATEIWPNIFAEFKSLPLTKTGTTTGKGSGDSMPLNQSASSTDRQ